MPTENIIGEAQTVNYNAAANSPAAPKGRLYIYRLDTAFDSCLSDLTIKCEMKRQVHSYLVDGTVALYRQPEVLYMDPVTAPGGSRREKLFGSRLSEKLDQLSVDIRPVNLLL